MRTLFHPGLRARPLELERVSPVSTDDPLWLELVSQQDDVNQLAIRAWLERAMMGLRVHLRNNPGDYELLPELFRTYRLPPLNQRFRM